MHMLDDHEKDVSSRCMIAMLVQCNDKMFYTQMKWYLWHDTIATMLTQICKDDDALDGCMYKMHKHDAHKDELMMHTVQCAYHTHFFPRLKLVSLVPLSKDQKLGH